ncbi:hypothetical protein [Dactylosporangium cerinum]
MTAVAVGAAALVFAFRLTAMLRHWTAPRARHHDASGGRDVS